MATRPHRLNPLWVAFLAIAGMLSVGDAAKACDEIKAAKACCAASPAANCHCCGSSDSSAPLSGAARPEGVALSESSATARLDVLRPGSSCECRINAPPAAPARKPESRSSDESRSNQGHNEVIAYLAYSPRPFIPAFRLVAASVSPPKSPLYLRTLHLLV